MVTGIPVAATCPTMPLPHEIRISDFRVISSTVELELTSNRLDTRQWVSVPTSPCTRNKEHLGNKRSSYYLYKSKWLVSITIYRIV